MNFAKKLAKQFRDIHFGGNWTAVNYQDVLDEVDWQTATIKVDDFNTIATLVYHTHYYIRELSSFLGGAPFLAKDKLSFVLPPIRNAQEWQHLLDTVFNTAEEFAKQLEVISDKKLNEIFIDEKYGDYYRNLIGIVEHHHYHLGQIVFLKKMIASKV